MEEAFLAEDEAEDAAQERERAAAAAAAAAATAAKQPRPLDQGGGLYFWEKVELGAKQRWARWAKQASGGPAPLAATDGAAAAAEKSEPQPVAAARAA